MNRELKQTALYFSSVLVGQALSFLLLPIVTRFLSASEYGEYALATAVSGLVAMFGSAWVRNVGMRFYYEAAERKQSKAFYVSTSILQSVLFTAIYLLGIAIVSRFDIVPLPPSVWLSAGVAMIVSDQFNYTTSLLRAEQRANSFAIAEIGSGVLRFVATAAGLFVGLRSAELLFNAASVGFVLGFAFAAPALWRRLTGPARIDRGVLQEILKTGPRSIPFSLSAWIERLADRLILQHFLGATVVGIYSIGYTLGERIIASLVQAVFMMAWPNILEAWTQAGVEGARKAIHSAQWLYAWTTVGPMLFLVAYGGELTRMVVGAEFHTAASIVPIVAIAIWLGGLGSYLNRHFELNKQYGTLSAISLLGAGVNLAATWALVPQFGMVGAALGTLLNYAFNAVVFFLTRDRSLGSPNFGPFVLAGIGSALAWLMSLLPSLGTITAMGTFVATYLIVALVALRQRPSSGIAS